MKEQFRETNPDLLAFWRDHAAPGRIGLIHVGLVAAKLISWGEKWVTPTGQASLWTHTFIFTGFRDEMPWIAESDVHIPLPGFRPKPDGPQQNSITKWSILVIDQAAVLETGLNGPEMQQVNNKVSEILAAGYTYRFAELAEAWVAMLKHDLTYQNPLHRDDSMHCGHFVRECLHAAGRDPFGANVLPHNTVPELFAQAFPTVAEWRKAPIST